MATEATYKLDELARAAGVSPRTVRYYVQRGLLPAPAFRGKDTAYSHEHLVRLRGIKHLQEKFLPLDAIQAELARRTAREIEEMIEGDQAKAPARQAAPPVNFGPYRSPPYYRLPGANEPRVGWVIPAEGAWTRVSPLPGLELHLADSADEETRRVFDEVLRWIERRRDGGR